MKIAIATEVEVPQEWLDFCLRCSDIFARDQCGYWAYGVARSHEKGWLVYVGDEAEQPEAEPERLAEAAWRRGGPLPTNFYRLDEAAAVKAFEVGCLRWGVNWFEDGATDALRYDYVVQVALLGEVVYG